MSLDRAGRRAWQVIGIAGAVLVCGWALGRLLPVLLPLGVALLLTTLLRPVAGALERRGTPPSLAALATVLALVAVLGGLSYVIVPPFVDRMSDLGANIRQGALEVAYSVGDDLGGLDHAEVNRVLDRVEAWLHGRLGTIAQDAVVGATTLVTALGAAVLVLFLCYFLVRDGANLWAWLSGFVPEARRAAVDETAGRVWSALGVYFRGVVFVATVDATLIGLALVLVGVPLAMPLIVLTWVAAFFPIIGAITAGAAATLVTLVAEGTSAALIVLAVIVVVQQLEGNVLYPVVIGPRLRLHPVAVLLAVVAGATIAGLAGAFLAVPVATVIASVPERPRA